MSGNFGTLSSAPCHASVSEFVSSIRKLIYSRYNTRYIQNDRRLISLLWTGQESDIEILKENNSDKKATQVIMCSLWSLVQQREFLFLRYFSSKQFVPTIRGTCGNMYAVASSPPTSILNPSAMNIARLSQHSWRDRAQVAIGLLDIVESARSDFHEYLHLCDIKGKNFGIAIDGRIKAIDTDSAFFDSKLGTWLTTYNTHCLQDSDCNFIACFGRCNSTVGRCETTVTNNNLEVISACFLICILWRNVYSFSACRYCCTCAGYVFRGYVEEYFWTTGRIVTQDFYPTHRLTSATSWLICYRTVSISNTTIPTCMSARRWCLTACMTSWLRVWNLAVANC